MAETQSLDARLADAIKANGEADRSTFVALRDEAASTIDELRATIETEEARILDLTNPDPDQSITVVASARLRIQRLTTAIPRLEQRIAAIDVAAQQAAWSEQANALRTESDDLYWALNEVYPSFVKTLDELFVKARANAAAFNELLGRAPQGVDHTFNEASPYSSFWIRVQLPDWSDAACQPPAAQHTA